MLLGTRLWLGAAGKGGQGRWLGAGVGGCSAGAGVRGSVFVKASLGGGTEGLGEVRAVVTGLDEEQFWC